MLTGKTVVTHPAVPAVLGGRPNPGLGSRSALIPFSPIWLRLSVAAAPGPLAIWRPAEAWRMSFPRLTGAC